MSCKFYTSSTLSLRKAMLAGTAGLVLSGCEMTVADMFAPAPAKSHQQLTSEAQAQQLTHTKQVLDVSTVKTAPTPTIGAIGYSVISSQPGKTLNQRRLMAIRAARMDAMRTLAEQIHGLTIEGETQLSEAVLQSDTLRASVSGAIRGARTVKIEPRGTDTYAVQLEMDRMTINQIFKAYRRR
ncbi:hypothetical protein NIG5292_02215 [Nereida ignava]|uniref:LPP20 lipoprotein n=1 Tax=Nereida ignava TaxID=282199 RepID=A0A0U1NN71_9RHOB|nr:LPP20 family lipoprotein [Nereida ignava]CRK76158.1 hypothetical protein NIG5292_02215 [Nereida ignava]SFJ57463.1 hypothetical protein SAMN02745667_01680 [Nereida ignava DSM 16309]